MSQAINELVERASELWVFSSSLDPSRCPNTTASGTVWLVVVQQALWNTPSIRFVQLPINVGRFNKSRYIDFGVLLCTQLDKHYIYIYGKNYVFIFVKTIYNLKREEYNLKREEYHICACMKCMACAWNICMIAPCTIYEMHGRLHAWKAWLNECVRQSEIHMCACVGCWSRCAWGASPCVMLV